MLKKFKEYKVPKQLKAKNVGKNEKPMRSCKHLAKRAFTFKTEMITKKKGKREYLNDVETKDFTKKLNNFF